MKYYSRLNLYKASNVQYDPSTDIALSYGWWQFVKPIAGKLVFNGYSYSSSTCKHQSKVRSLLYKTGRKIDLEIEAPEGLQNLRSALEWNRQKLANAIDKAKRARLEHTRNSWNLEALEAKEAIDFLVEVK